MDPVAGAQLGAAGIGAGASLINTVASVFGARHAEKVSRQNMELMHNWNVQDAINHPLYNVMGADRAGIAKSTLGDNAFTGSVQSPSGSPAGVNPITSPVFDALGMAKLASDIELSRAEAKKLGAETNEIEGREFRAEDLHELNKEFLDSQITKNAAEEANQLAQSENFKDEHDKTMATINAFGSWTAYGQQQRDFIVQDFQNKIQENAVLKSQVRLNDEQINHLKEMVKEIQKRVEFMPDYLRIQRQLANAATTQANAAVISANAASDQANNVKQRLNFDVEQWNTVGKAIQKATLDVCKANKGYLEQMTANLSEEEKYIAAKEIVGIVTNSVLDVGLGVTAGFGVGKAVSKGLSLVNKPRPIGFSSYSKK